MMAINMKLEMLNSYVITRLLVLFLLSFVSLIFVKWTLWGCCGQLPVLEKNSLEKSSLCFDVRHRLLPTLLQKSAALQRLPKIRNISLNNACNQWGVDMELFLPVPPTVEGFRELQTYVMPSLELFWPPQELKLLFLTDGEVSKASRFAKNLKSLYRQTEGEISVAFNCPTRQFPRGWDRQQWLMFWADNFTSADYVGFVDSDTVFVTRVTKSDLFVDNRPIVRGLYGKPYDPNWWTRVPKTTAEAIGSDEPFTCMSYFPVILKTNHLPLMREHIRKQMGTATFDEAFNRIAFERAIYSQFNIMCAYLWYYHHDSYYWIIGQRDWNWRGPIPDGQVRDPLKAGLTPEYFQRQRPNLAIHWNYEHFKNDPTVIKTIHRRGVCFSMTANDPNRDEFCKSSGAKNRTEEVNLYEWTFEGYDLTGNMTNAQTLLVHQERLRLNDKCPHQWNRTLVKELLH